MCVCVSWASADGPTMYKVGVCLCVHYICVCVQCKYVSVCVCAYAVCVQCVYVRMQCVCSVCAVCVYVCVYVSDSADGQQIA